MKKISKIEEKVIFPKSELKIAKKEQPEGLKRVVTWNPVTNKTEILNNCLSVNDGYMWMYFEDFKNFKLGLKAQKGK